MDPYFNKVYKLEKSEGFDKFLKDSGKKFLQQNKILIEVVDVLCNLNIYNKKIYFSKKCCKN
jgi:hypothetical protein